MKLCIPDSIYKLHYEPVKEDGLFQAMKAYIKKREKKNARTR